MEFKPKLMGWVSGGMPNRNLEEACRVMLRYFPEAPSVPQLSTSLEKRLQGLPCLKFDKAKNEASFDFSSERENELVEFYERYLADDLDYFAVPPDLGPGVYELAQVVGEKPRPELKVIHTHVRGPYTTGFAVKDENGAPAFYNDTMRDVIIKQVAMQTRWRERKIKELFPGVQTLIHFGEAALGVYTSAVGSGSWEVIGDALNEVMAAVEGIAGIHCCANVDWSLLMETNIDAIHFDAYQFGQAMSLYPDTMNRFLERGGMIAWGIVPTPGSGDIADESPDSLMEKLEQILQSVIDRGVDKERLLELSWVGPSCSTSTMTVELSDRSYVFTKELSERMREKYFG